MQTQTDWFQIFKWGSDMNIDERVSKTLKRIQDRIRAGEKQDIAPEINKEYCGMNLYCI